MTKEELIQKLKENNEIALDVTTQDNIRKVIRFNDQGYFCAYLGVRKEHPWYKIRKEDQANDVFYGTHGGITYVNSYLPFLDDNDGRRWFGVDFAHGLDNRNIDLVREVYGDEQAEIVSMVFPYNPDKQNWTFERVCVELDEMELQAIEGMGKHIVPNVVVDHIVQSGPVSLIIPFDMIEPNNGLNAERMENIKNYLGKHYGPVENFEVSVNIHVPMIDAVFYTDVTGKTWPELEKIIPEEDEFEVKIPIDLMQRYHDEYILTDDDFRYNDDLRLSRFLKEGYYARNMKDMLLWMSEHDLNLYKAISEDDLKKACEGYGLDVKEMEDMER